MFSVFALLVAFVLGGLTFIPIVLATILGLLYYTSPIAPPLSKTGIPQIDVKTEDETEPITLYRAGWLIVRRTYEPWAGANDGTYVGMLANGYRSFMDNRSRDPRRAKPKERFYAVLKQNVLFLFETEAQVDCWAAIEVSAHDLILYPELGLDGELFVKRNAIVLRPKLIEGDIVGQSHAGHEHKTHDMEPATPLPWFLFAQVNSDKEDWYHSLVQASKMTKGSDAAASLAKDKSLFDPEDMARLVDGIDQQPDSIPMRWLNALLGRVFLAVYRTSSLENYIVSRIVRKLKRVKTPSMLSEIKVREVNVGSAAPLFSKPMLKELTAEGDASMEVHVSYVGDFRITIETVATINLGSRFKPYSVKLVLAVVLKELEGTMLFKIKRPPSGRLWFGFTVMPKMTLSVEPVVSTRQIKWSMITSPIESRLREVILESIVVPHMDDIAFFNTQPFPTRGGIWGEALRKEPDLSEEEGTPAIDPEADVDLSSEPVPIVGGLKGDNEATTSAKEESLSNARIRPRRRRSSEGDRSPLDMTSADQPTEPYKTGANTSSSSLSSFSLAAWREAKKDKDPNPSAPTAAAEKRRTWFSGTRSSSVSVVSTPTSPDSSINVPPPLTASRASSSDRLISSSTSAADDSAARLREMLQKRAKSRERERSAEHVVEEKEEVAAKVLEEAPVSDDKDILGQSAPSALSLTAPTMSTASAGISNHSSATASLESLPTSFAPDSISTLSHERKFTDSPDASSLDLTTNSPSTVESASFPPSKTAPIEGSNAVAEVSTVRDPIVDMTSSPPRIGGPLHSPSRPSYIKPRPQSPSPLPLPPPRRAVETHTASNAPAAASIISSWRTKAADKEAIAAGVAQAKDAMKRWGANWNSRRKGEEEGPSPPQDGGQLLGSSSTKPNEEDGSYRDYRTGKTAPADRGNDYYHPSAIEHSNPITMANPVAQTSEALEVKPRRNTLSSSPSNGHFAPGAAAATTSISPIATLAAGSPEPVSTPPRAVPPPPLPHRSPASPQVPARAYKPATMMSIPGIRDETRRKAIAADHMAATEEAKPSDASLAITPSTITSTPDLSKADSSVAGPPTPPREEEIAEEETTPSQPAKPPIPARPGSFSSSAASKAATDAIAVASQTNEHGNLGPAAPIDIPRESPSAQSRPAWIQPKGSRGSTPDKTTALGAAGNDEETADEDEWGLTASEVTTGDKS